MRPQEQLHRGGDGIPGDCHRTCIAMILDLPRDEVPHFMRCCQPGLPTDHPDHVEATDWERRWLAHRNLARVDIPFPGDLELPSLIEQIKVTAPGVAVILGCRSTNGFDHSVVVYDGYIYNPNHGGIAGPMNDGHWWVSILAHRTKPLTQDPVPGSVVMQEKE